MSTNTTTILSSQQPIHIPSSLINNKRKRKISHHDIANLIHLQKNPEIIRQHKEKHSQSFNNRSKIVKHEDFITMYLVKWSLVSLIKVTNLLINIIDHQQEDDNNIDNYNESFFSNNTPIKIIQENDNDMDMDMNIPNHIEISFKCYFKMIYNSAIEENKKNENEKNQKNHIINLLRACFLIAFIYDERIRRFVMTNHSIHFHYMSTRPPDIDIIRNYIDNSKEIINNFLYDNNITIIEMIEQCISIWVRSAMI